MGAEFVQFSLTPMLIGTLAAMACALPGNFLILRRQALIGDAISHVVLPGIVVGFLVSGSIAAGPMGLGASAGAAIVAVVLIEAIRRYGRVEPGAAMGVVFTTMFAAGVLLLEQTGSAQVHLDVEHALMGNLEQLIWLRASGWQSLTDPSALAALPPRIAPHGAGLRGDRGAGGPVLALAEKSPHSTKASRNLWAFHQRLGLWAGDCGGAGRGSGVSGGGIDPCDCHVHLPPGCRPADDQPFGRANLVVASVRRALGHSGLCAGRLRPALARRAERDQRGGDDRGGVRRHSGTGGAFLAHISDRWAARDSP